VDRHVKVGVDDISIASENRFVIENALSRLGLFFNLHLFGLFFSFDEDINPDFVSESVVVTGNHTEIGGVSTWFLGSVAVKSPGVFCLRLDNTINSSGLNLEVISVGLHEDSVLRPCGLAIIAEGPLFTEGHSTGDWEFITKTLLDESSRVFDELGLFRVLLGSETAYHVFIDLLFGFFFFHLHLGHLRGTIHSSRVVLAKEGVGSVRGVADLQERVLVVNALSFTVLA